MKNRLQQIKDLGQSVWLDNLARPMITEGHLARLVREDGVSGITSNPAIFNAAMTRGNAYDAQIKALATRGKSAMEIYEALAIEDIRGAADILRPVYDSTQGTDGFVSLEVSPHLARDTDGTLKEARRLWAAVKRPNIFIKIPGTEEGIPAVEKALTEGINVNVTLLFSLSAYQSVIEAHFRAMEARHSKSQDLSSVASVASFFLSRIDSKVDKMLDGMSGNPKAKTLRGKAAVASGKLAYQLWKNLCSTGRWKKLETAGARVQKPLWASTSTKDPAYRDVLYVEPLIGPNTINTMPDQTVDAFRDHGNAELTVEKDVETNRTVMKQLADVGIDIDRVTDDLVTEGIDKFITPFDALLKTLEAKRKRLAEA